MSEQKETVRKPRQPRVDKVAKAQDTEYSTAPKADLEIEKVETNIKEVLIQTPSGRLDKKTYQIFQKVVIKSDGTKSVKGSYKKLIKTEKGVKG